MQITEMDKLIQDRERLHSLRRSLEDFRAGLEISKRPVDAWLKLRLTRWIAETKDKIVDISEEIAAEESRIRKGAGENDTAIMGRRAEQRETDEPAGDHPAAAADRGRDEEDGGEEHQRSATAAGVRGQLVDMGAVRGVAAKHAAGGREYAKTGGSAESCLRMRYGERHPGLRDWQKQIMENDRRGKHEERITV